MPTYKSPGVYVEEISTLPPSVAEVATAIPAFIGTTELGGASTVEIAQISTMLEYEQRFGKPSPTQFTAREDGSLEPIDPMPERSMWYALSLYFKNGGGRCYVVSVDDYQSPLAHDRFEAGLEAIAKEDELTLLVMPEIVALDSADFFDLCQQALTQCGTLGDRFALLDAKEDATAEGVTNDPVAANRTGYGAEHLAYGAAYHPYLQTTLVHAYDEKLVTLGGGADAPTLESLKSNQTALYNQIKKNLALQRVALPPSAAIAGVYARVDRERGVWKAPGNVGVLSVLGPTRQISHGEQEGLNVDANSGKSINAIRAFAGRGTLVWGARTLAGNDNEWRYVSVRRLFITVEESAKKASAFAVFEPNDATTWLKVKGMLESYLYGLWEQGALQGATAEAAYYVSVGLGKTMTPQDVLEGRMIVEIGLAVVRPAEFVVLRFSHKLVEA